jgi:tetratricopeptide (TPR) repeat protein/transcriptional regulator with XRE-family HTH domain
MGEGDGMFGQWVREHRLRLGVTQEELAERTGMGVRTIRDIESSRVSRPRPGTVRLLAKAFDLSEADSERFRLLAAQDASGKSARARPSLGSPIPGASNEEGGAARPVPAQLPLDLPGFVGRDTELAHLDSILDARGRSGSVAVSVVSGTAGVGKTRLALRWAHRVARRFPDGQLYVNLRGFDPTGSPTSPAQALRGFLDALGVPAQRIPIEPDTQASLYRTLLAKRKMLVVLDNARDADQIRPLLPGAPGSLVLITSRNQLSGLATTEGAQLLALDLLSHSEARQLLAHRLGSRVEEETGATDEIITACARLSLALAIVASRAASNPSFPLAALATELSEARDRLQALGGDGDPLSDVRTVLSWSYHALNPDAAGLFRLLGLAPGHTISVAAAAALTGHPPQLSRRLLAQLAQSNLIEELSPDRYSFHDLLRLYAAERVWAEESPCERGTARLRLLNYYLYTADAAACLLSPQKLRFAPPPPSDYAAGFEEIADASAWLDTERANLVAAVCHAAEHGPRQVAWLLAESLRGYFWMRTNLADWRITAYASLAAAEADSDVHGQIAAQSGLAHMHFSEGQHHLAIERYTRSLEFAERAGWQEGQAGIRGNLGAVYRQIGQLTQAADHLTQALRTLQQTGHLPGQAVHLLNLGVVKYVLGELTEAAECYSQALARYRKIGSQGGEATALVNLAEVWHALGNHDAAREHIDQALALARPIGSRGNEAEGLRLLAAWHRDTGDDAETLAQALDLAEAATAVAHHSGQGRYEANCLNTTASIHLRLGHPARALEAHRQALELARTVADRYPLATALIGLATAHHHLGQPGPAHNHAHQALTVAQHAGYRLLECEALRCLATTRLADAPAEAADWARQALTIHTDTGYRLGEDATKELYSEAISVVLRSVS